MRKDEKSRGRGRPATGRNPITSLRLPQDLLARIDGALAAGEKRSDLIRAAIERELERRGKL